MIQGIVLLLQGFAALFSGLFLWAATSVEGGALSWLTDGLSKAS